MKILKLLNLGLIALFVLLMSCSSDEGGKISPEPDIKSVTLSLDGLSDVLKDEDIPFQVKDDKGNDIKSKAKIYIDDVEVTGSSLRFDKEKSYEVHAAVGDVISEKISVNAIEATHTTKILIEDYTGTWCGYCPRLATALEKLVESNSNVVPVALHDDNSFPFPGVKTLVSLFNVRGFPTGKVNRVIDWDETSTQVTPYLNKKRNLGLAINSSIAGDNITVNVKVHYDVKSSGKNRLVVYVLENGLVASQANYFNGDSSSPWYQKGNPITDFIHNHTARKSLTILKGDDIPEDENATGSTYAVSFNSSLPSSIKDREKLELVAFVVDKNNAVINVQKAKVGEDKDFD